MTAVVDVLLRYVDRDRLPEFLADLEYAGSANALFLEFVRRIRRSAGIPAPDLKEQPKPLLDLLEQPPAGD